MPKDALDTEYELRESFNALNRKCREIAAELMIDFKAQSENPDLKNPADAPQKYHSAFLGTVQSYLSDLDCDGDW